MVAPGQIRRTLRVDEPCRQPALARDLLGNARVELRLDENGMNVRGPRPFDDADDVTRGRLLPGGGFDDGDFVQLVYSGAAPLYGAVLSIDGAQHVSRYFPEFPEELQRRLS